VPAAKQVIDRRITLEARRLLVHSQTALAETGHQLGFSEAPNFVKFLKRVTGSTPSPFRKVMTTASEIA
jgi:AraC-like DNA-binding protein